MSRTRRPLIVLAAAEAAPLAKVGGLADVTQALFAGLRRWFEIVLFLPFYPAAQEDGPVVETVRFSEPIPGPGQAVSVMRSERRSGVFFISHPEYFDGRPYIYDPPGGYCPDNLERFALFSASVLEACRRLGLRPACFHCHDWHTALLPVYLKERYRDSFPDSLAVLTIHNLGYQGLAPSDRFSHLGLPDSCWTPEGIEFYGQVNPLKAGIIYADRVTTVSKGYAREILTPEFGCGLDVVLAARNSPPEGIRNGVNYRVWNPRCDPVIFRRYASPRGKLANRGPLRAAFGLENDRPGPLVSFVGRLVPQKGIDLLVSALEHITARGAYAVVLGDGPEPFRSVVADACRRLRGSVSLRAAFDENLARIAYAGSDIFLMPSLFEPCGIAQLIAMKYGCIPVVTRRGGLADTVTDIEEGGWGFTCEPTAASVRTALDRAFDAYSDPPTWQTLVERAMTSDFSWRQPLVEYRRLFTDLLRTKR